MVDLFVAYNTNQHHYSIPSRHTATNVLTEEWKRWVLGRRLRWPRFVRVREQRVMSLEWSKKVGVMRSKCVT